LSVYDGHIGFQKSEKKSNLKHVHIQVNKPPFNGNVADILDLESNLREDLT
jgi:hypothetical protein